MNHLYMLELKVINRHLHTHAIFSAFNPDLFQLPVSVTEYRTSFVPKRLEYGQQVFLAASILNNSVRFRLRPALCLSGMTILLMCLVSVDSEAVYAEWFLIIVKN